jgi:hypothetical protein
MPISFTKCFRNRACSPLGGCYSPRHPTGAGHALPHHLRCTLGSASSRLTRSYEDGTNQTYREQRSACRGCLLLLQRLPGCTRRPADRNLETQSPCRPGEWNHYTDGRGSHRRGATSLASGIADVRCDSSRHNLSLSPVSTPTRLTSARVYDGLILEGPFLASVGLLGQGRLFGTRRHIALRWDEE